MPVLGKAREGDKEDNAIGPAPRGATCSRMNLKGDPVEPWWPREK